MSKVAGKIKNAVKKKKNHRAGMPPGSVVYLGEQKMDNVRITVMDYSENSFTENVVADIDPSWPQSDSNGVKWINIDGLHNVELIERVGRQFNIHSLILEDIVHTRQRPKMEELEGNIYIVLKMITFDEEQQQLKSEQVSIVFGNNYVISFQEMVGDVFDPVRQRIRNGKGRIRKMGCDYLMYALLDSIVDNYFVVLESFSDRIELLQEQVAVDPTEEVLHSIHNMKRELLILRKAVWPLRELIGSMQKVEADIIQPATQIFLRDVYDHIVQTIDTTEALREMAAGILDVYLSSISNRMNAVMKVLTIIATIFIPLTFVSGIYGMNFEHMPELAWKWGYPWGFWLIISVIIIVMLSYFRNKKWL